MTKPYSDMYNYNHFTNLEQEHSNFLYHLQTFTDPGHKLNPDVLGREVWMVQYNGPLQLVGQKASPTQVLYDKQTNADKVKDAVKDIRWQIHYKDKWLDRMQESMKELQVIQETTPKGEGMTRNHSLAPNNCGYRKQN